VGSQYGGTVRLAEGGTLLWKPSGKIQKQGEWRTGMDQTKPIKVLIVEDQYLISLQLSHTLRSWSPSISIITADNGTEGLLKTRQIKPDLIITDLAMPKMDGYEMVKAIRQEQNSKSIPIIGISASDPADVRASAFRTLCDDYLNKPFYQREVLEKVNALLSRTESIS
jgi:adenylate cyclase